MNAEEAAEVERRLRRIAVTHDLEWVLEECDATIALGVFEVRELRETTVRGVTEYTAPLPRKSNVGRRRTQEFISQREMDAHERARTLVEAFRRALVELPAVPKATLDLLELDGEAYDDVASIRFFDEVDGLTASMSRDSEVAPIARLRPALDELLRAVGDE